MSVQTASSSCSSARVPSRRRSWYTTGSANFGRKRRRENEFTEKVQLLERRVTANSAEPGAEQTQRSVRDDSRASRRLVVPAVEVICVGSLWRSAAAFYVSRPM